MNRKGLIRRLKMPEWDDLEAKEAGKELPKDIWKTVSAFCNTNGGNLVLGVRDLGKGSLEITGVENADKIQNDFITTLRSAKFNIQLSSKGRLFTIEGRKVITFRLPPMPRQAKPVYYNDDIRNTYIRQGATNQKASKDEIGRMLREASEFSSDSMLIAGSGIKEIDRETLRTYLRYLEIQNQEHPFIALKDIQVLEKCGAMKEGTLTMAGLLLFGKTAAIRIHDDRIVFRNPGAAPFPIEQILTGCESVPRNPNIARVFRLPGWAEIAGSGMMKIFDNWQAAGYVQPVIRNNEPTHWFTIEFSEKSLGPEKEAVGPGETAQESTRKTTQKQQETPGKTPGKIMELLKDNPTLSIPELAEKMKKSESAVERAIRKLRQSGLLKRVGPAKGGYWEIIEEGKN